MGLHCSRQGYIQEFHELKESRIAPEGQCIPADLLKSNNANLTPEQIKRLRVLLQDESLAKRLSASLCISNFDHHERVLYGQEDRKTSTNDYRVTLPPEGKVGNEAEFVELPVDKLFNDTASKHNLIVDIPSEACFSEENSSSHHVLQINNNNSISYNTVNDVDEEEHVYKDSTDSSKAGSTRNHSDGPLATKEEEDSADDNQWMYTLYDFQENGIVTKQDVNRLMDSICSVVNSTLTDEKHESNDYTSENNNLKVHLEIGRRKKSETHNHHTNPQQQQQQQIKIHHSKQLSTNKCSKRFLPSRKCKGMIFPPPNSAEADKVSSYIEEKVLHHRRKTSQQNQQHDTSSSKTRHATRDLPTTKSTCRKCITYYDKNNSHPENSRLLRRRRGSEPCRTEKHTERVLVTQPLIHHTEGTVNGSGARYNKKRGGSCDVSNSDHSLSPSSMSGSNTPFSADEVFLQQRSYEKVTDNSRFRHSCSCRRKPRSKYSDNICDNDNNKYRTAGFDQREQRLSSRASSHDEKSTVTSYQDNHRNEHRKKFRRHTNHNAIMSVRPEVWPGGAASVVSDKVEAKDPGELCFCKRMLGLDYPCNHSL